MRNVIVILHRWAGLFMAGPLLLAGLTGALLAFGDAINHHLAPEVYADRAEGPISAPGELAAMVERTMGAGLVDWVYIDDRGNGRVGVHGVGAHNLLIVDPASGAIRHRLDTTRLPTDLPAIMPFVYRLHYSLAAGSTGYWIMGICAVLWTADTLLALWLTFPAKPPARAAFPSGRTWLERWMPAWRIRWNRGTWKMLFDVHRGFSLWLWFALLLFAWSSVGFNMHSAVYRPVMGLALDMGPGEIPDGRNAPGRRRLEWSSAQVAADSLLRQLSVTHHFEMIRSVALYHFPAAGRYQLLARTSLDIGVRNGDTWIDFDDQTGELLQVRLPTGQYSGHTVSTWLVNLHEANLFGFPYRLFVSLFGTCVACLCITGIYIWSKKLRARRPRRRESNFELDT